ncbi:MAG: hypothetical protein RSG52_15215 [Terrisporobacter sp.]|uniref:ABC-three component system middle component 2 n=1 Tax=Terrisporobacter sp. TaxID=1965305 RepID=UPI002FC706F0
MSKVFNTTFETSLRVLLNLYTTKNKGKTIDTIAAYDFITIYSSNFTMSDINLHGDNELSFSEFATKRYLVGKSIKSLVLDNLVSVSKGKNGFYFYITKNGIKLCENMNTEYADSYVELCKLTYKYLQCKTEKEILDLIRKKSMGKL